MIERRITFDTARLAKEKEFGYDFAKQLPEYVPMFYCELNLDFNLDLTTLEESECQGKDITRCDFYFRPTQSLLQKWLREVHDINIFMTFKPNIKKWDFIPYSMGVNAKEYIKHNYEYNKQNNERRFNTYEEALEIGLQEALKLI